MLYPKLSRADCYSRDRVSSDKTHGYSGVLPMGPDRAEWVGVPKKVAHYTLHRKNGRLPLWIGKARFHWERKLMQD